LLATAPPGRASRNRPEENEQRRVLQSICSFAPGKVLSSRLVLSCLASLTKRISGVSTFQKSKSCLRRQTEGLVAVLPAEPSQVTYVILPGTLVPLKPQLEVRYLPRYIYSNAPGWTAATAASASSQHQLHIRDNIHSTDQSFSSCSHHH
jgi:hypothetical protein